MLRTITVERSTLELLKVLQQIPLLKDGVRMAAMKDIAAMKLSAITNRGTKKDFVDIYFLLQHFSLEEMMNLYERKYPHGSSFNVLRG